MNDSYGYTKVNNIFIISISEWNTIIVSLQLKTAATREQSESIYNIQVPVVEEVGTAEEVESLS